MKKFGKIYNISSACAYGGGSLYEQTLACQNGVEILVSTPVCVLFFIYLLSSLVFMLFLFNKKGRLIDLIKKKGTNFLRVTFLVLDEADRMFDMVRINSKFMLKLSYFFLDFYIYFF